MTVNAATPGQAARDLPAEEATREFAGWAEAQGYASDTGGRPEYAIGDMADAFAAGMQAARDLAAPEPVSPAQAAQAVYEAFYGAYNDGTPGRDFLPWDELEEPLVRMWHAAAAAARMEHL